MGLAWALLAPLTTVALSLQRYRALAAIALAIIPVHALLVIPAASEGPVTAAAAHAVSGTLLVIAIMVMVFGRRTPRAALRAIVACLPAALLALVFPLVGLVIDPDELAGASPAWRSRRSSTACSACCCGARWAAGRCTLLAVVRAVPSAIARSDPHARLRASRRCSSGIRLGELARAVVGDQQVALLAAAEGGALLPAVALVGLPVAADHERLEAACPYLPRDALPAALESPRAALGAHLRPVQRPHQRARHRERVRAQVRVRERVETPARAAARDTSDRGIDEALVGAACADTMPTPSARRCPANARASPARAARCSSSGSTGTRHRCRARCARTPRGRACAAACAAPRTGCPRRPARAASSAASSRNSLNTIRTRCSVPAGCALYDLAKRSSGSIPSGAHTRWTTHTSDFAAGATRYDDLDAGNMLGVRRRGRAGRFIQRAGTVPVPPVRFSVRAAGAPPPTCRSSTARSTSTSTRATSPTRRTRRSAATRRGSAWRWCSDICARAGSTRSAPRPATSSTRRAQAGFEVSGIEPAGPGRGARPRARSASTCRPASSSRRTSRRRASTSCARGTCWSTSPSRAPRSTKLHAALRPGGHLLLEVPNIESVYARRRGEAWFNLDPEHHVGHYARRSLQHVLERSGFEVLGMETFPALGYVRPGRGAAPGQRRGAAEGAGGRAQRAPAPAPRPARDAASVRPATRPARGPGSGR